MNLFSPFQDDFDLVQRLLHGDPDTLEGIAVRLQCIPRILSSLNSRRGQPFQAEDLADLAQDVFVVVWEKLDQYDGRARIESWIYRFCDLEFASRVRKRHRRSSILRHAAGDLLKDGPAEPGDSAPWDAEELQRGLDTLDPGDRAVLHLRHFEELSFDQAAEMLGVPSSTAKTRYYRGIEMLEAFLTNRGADPA